MKKILLYLFCSLSLSASTIVSGDDYYTSGDKEVEIIFTKEHIKQAIKAKNIVKPLLKEYEKSFAYTLDQKLYLGLLSSKNQIANAFSTQFPLNMEMNYIGGSYMVDYMSVTSWLKTLILHESAHNFQLNPKKNPLSHISHKILKNTPFSMLFFMPIFPVPNIFENNFIIEGNAVFNESRFGNGGRLYNGALLAMTIVQAHAGLITPERTYNEHLYFPYRTHYYIIGGFFQLYLAQKYTTDKVNGYFYNYSGQYFPIQVNAIFKQTFGNDFESEIKNYSNWLKDKYSGFTPSIGEFIANSKYYQKLNSTEDEILFMTSDAISEPYMHRFVKKDLKDMVSRTSFPFGVLFKVDDKYYSLASKQTDVDEIMFGLFDEDARVLQRSKSKILQDLNKNGDFVYFDVATSFEQPKLYVNDKYYCTVNSSVFVDSEDNLYYFKQKQKVRTLYKNKQAILSFEGWYGFVTDVNDQGILFVANSKNGSSVYIYNGVLTKASSGDDVVDAKYIDDETMLLTVIRSDGYDYIKTKIIKSSATVYNREYFFEKNDSFKMQEYETKELDNIKEYSSIKNIHLSSLNYSLVINDDEDIDFSLGANFNDPLEENSFNVYVAKHDETTAGLGYSNSKYLLKYGLNVYTVLENKNDKDRDFGLNLFANYPIYQKGYTKLDVGVAYHLDHEKDEKEPLSLNINLENYKHYGNSLYPNYLNKFLIFGVVDDEDVIGGFSYNYFRDFIKQFYAGVGLKYAKSKLSSITRKSGININDDYFSSIGDPSHFTMPTLKSDVYVKEALAVSASIFKVFDFDVYTFRFPISLRRESIYLKYNYYDLTFLNDFSADFSEYIAGANFDLLFFNKLPIPLSFEYMYNDNLKDPKRFRVLFNLPF